MAQLAHEQLTNKARATILATISHNTRTLNNDRYNFEVHNNASFVLKNFHPIEMSAEEEIFCHISLHYLQVKKKMQCPVGYFTIRCTF